MNEDAVERASSDDDFDRITPSSRSDGGPEATTVTTEGVGRESADARGRSKKFLPEMSMKTYMREAETIEIEDEGSDEDKGTKRRHAPVVMAFEKDTRKFTTRMIGGCQVKFPEGLDPHPAQMMTMSTIIRTLTRKEHAMIESPTGTGKTLALLCGALAWQEKNKVEMMASGMTTAVERAKYEKARVEYLMQKCDPTRKKPPVCAQGPGWSADDEYFKPGSGSSMNPKIFICSRTHSQLGQILGELKRTGYSPRYSVLSSRQRMCQMQKNDAECKQLIGSDEGKKKTGTTGCPYYNKHTHVVRAMERYPLNGSQGMYPQAWDMEDFERVVDEVDGCSFFALRKMYESADVVFCPYNYLFDINIRRKMSIETEGACVIIDEGHNIEDVCREGASAEFSLQAVGEAMDALSKNLGHVNVETNMLADFFRSISAFLEDMFRTNRAESTIIQSNQVPSFLQEMLSRFDAEHDMVTLSETVNDLMTTKAKHLTPIVAPHISLAGDLASIVTMASTQPEAYNVIFGMKVDINSDSCPGVIIQCMKPSVAFNSVAQKARSVILTSGTLSPMTTFEAELGVRFGAKIEAPHVVPNENVYVEVTGALGEITYKATESENAGRRFAQNLGNYLLRYAKIIPGGMLVFFPKYSLIERVVREWHMSGLFGQLNDHKFLCCETRGAKGFQETLNQFDRGNTRSGSLMLAVYRGKVSEGIDFKDDKARAVFCVGIPFPSVFDPRVKAKKEFNDSSTSKQQGMLAGGEWYRAQAYRAYNQALGRCIRHPKDYAALFIVDARFREGGAWMLNNISKWIRNNTRASDDVNVSVGQVSAFFKRLRSMDSAPSALPGEPISSQSYTPLVPVNQNQNGPPSPTLNEKQGDFLLSKLRCEANRELVDALDSMHRASVSAREEPMKVNAYAKALTSIRELTYEVTDGKKMSTKGPEKVQHIGASMGAQIDHWLKHRVFERMAYYEKGQLPPAK